VTKKLPRYREIADELLSDITTGKFAVGAMLPTEIELCERFAVSRFTVREALRRLHDMGLLHRRRGAGTVVRAPDEQGAFVQSMDSLSALLQYPPETKIEVLGNETLAADAAQARLLRCRVGRKWVKIRCVRWVHRRDTPICWTDVYVVPRYRSVISLIGSKPGPIHALLIEKFGETVKNVKVALFASGVPANMAEIMGVAQDTPAMTIVRRYTGNANRIFQVSVSVHPEGRFTYAMNLEREWRVRAS